MKSNRIIWILLFFLISCTNVPRTHYIFDQAYFERWEKVTMDSINLIYTKNLSTANSKYESYVYSGYINKSFNHGWRMFFIRMIKMDFIYNCYPIDNMVLIELNKIPDPYSYGYLFYKINNKWIGLFYDTKFSFNRRILVRYIMKEIDSNKLKTFIELSRKAEKFHINYTEINFFQGNAVVSVFKKDTIKVYPFLNLSLSGKLYSSFEELLPDKNIMNERSNLWSEYY